MSKLPKPSPTGAVIISCEYPPFPGGIATYAGKLTEELRRSGFRTITISPDYAEFGIRDQAHTDDLRILEHHRIPRSTERLIHSTLRSLPSTWPCLAADYRSALFLSAIGHPYRAMIHGSEVSSFGLRQPQSQGLGTAYQRAEMITANSQATLRAFNEVFGIRGRSRVTYLGVEDAWFEPPVGQFEHPQLAAIEPSSNVVCAVGRLDARKGQLQTIQALARATDRFGLVAPVLVAAGHPVDAAYAKQLTIEAERLGVSLVAPGRLSQGDLKRLYHRAACHTLLAQPVLGKSEGFGLVLLESGAQRCPSVANQLGGIAEALGGQCTLTDADDCDAQAMAIARYVADPSFRSAHGEAMRQRAHEFTWTRCARGTFPDLAWDQAGVSS